MEENETLIEGRNAVLEAFRSGKTIDKLFVQKDCKDGPIRSILREAEKCDTIVNFVTKAYRHKVPTQHQSRCHPLQT